MDRRIYIEFYDNKPIEYMPVSKMYWCLWSEDYVSCFNETANELVNELSDQINAVYQHTWKHWDLDDVSYNTDKYI